MTTVPELADHFEVSRRTINRDIERVKAVFDPSMKWQLVEEYGLGSFEEQPDGTREQLSD